MDLEFPIPQISYLIKKFCACKHSFCHKTQSDRRKRPCQAVRLLYFRFTKEKKRFKWCLLHSLFLSPTQTHNTHSERPCSGLPVWVDLQHRFIKLRDLSVDEGLQCLLQPVIIPLQLPLVLLLVWTDQALILTQGIFTSVGTDSLHTAMQGLVPHQITQQGATSEMPRSHGM